MQAERGAGRATRRGLLGDIIPLSVPPPLAAAARRRRWARRRASRVARRQQRVHRRAARRAYIYDPKADGAAKWSADIDKTHNLKMDTFMKHADKCLQLGEKPFKSGGMKLAAGS